MNVMKLKKFIYFRDLAQLTASMGTCPRAKVGCVIVKDDHVVSTGYNGSLPGLPHCEDVGCDMRDGHCIRAVHSEANAVAQAAKLGVSIDGSTAFCTHSPCPYCYKLLVSAGVKKIVAVSMYRDWGLEEAAKESGVTVVAL